MLKFKTIYTSNTFEYSTVELSELMFWCNEFAKKDLAPKYDGGSYGNLSYRCNNGGFIITKSGVDLGKKLDPSDFVKVLSCNYNTLEIHVQGTAPPSSESMLHYSIYYKRPEITAIFHGHSLPININAEKEKIPQTEKELPYGTIELVKEALKLANNNFFNLKNHGFFSLAETMKEAGYRAIELHNLLNY
ncbi:MAG: class II aldolase/adducin family protein [Bacteroidales bacterium]